MPFGETSPLPVQDVFAYNRNAKNLSEMVRFARRVGVQRRRARWQKPSKT